MSGDDILNLNKDYIVFDGQGQAVRWTADAFWKAAFAPSHPAIHPAMGALVSRYSFDKDWDSWEMHPHGDELIYLTKGRLIFILGDKAEKRIEAKAGDAFIIPKGTWHTAKVVEPAETLFITFGYGTEHRSVQA